MTGQFQKWQDPQLGSGERADALLAEMTIQEKLAQLVGLWVGADASGGGVAPHQADMSRDVPDWDTVTEFGLGQLTRPFGTAPVEPRLGAKSLAASQRQIMERNRFGIPAQVHEECLAGFSAWKATAYPVPLSWGATFNPELIEKMAHLIGTSMRRAGVHQGLSPVLDVARDYRWGRTEETISEDPYLVGTVGSAYVKGLEEAGIVATLKHFAGYSASKGARNLAPVSMGPREFKNVILPPFEMALRHGKARSVMHSYSDVDGVPSAADENLLSSILRDDWGFEGTVVADYFGIRFLETLHSIAGDSKEAAYLALKAGVDVELPSIDAYGAPLLEAVQAGQVPIALVDRALRRVLIQKIELGLLDPDWVPVQDQDLNLDTVEQQELALEIARESLCLVQNTDKTLPLSTDTKVAVVGPLADEALSMLGCYSFPAHVGGQHPEVPLGLNIPTVKSCLQTEFGEVKYVRGCDVDTQDRSGFAAAKQAAQEAQAVVVVVGDRAGLFGRGTSGEGCDAPDLRLPGVQQDLIEELSLTGVPLIVVNLSGRPYAMGEFADKVQAIIQGFFPGQFGGQAVAEIISGQISPSGRLPIGVPRDSGSQPATYLAAPLGQKTGVSNLDPTALFGFGHGLSFTDFSWSNFRFEGSDGSTFEDGESGQAPAIWEIDGNVKVSLTVANNGAMRAAETVLIFVHDRVTQVAQPVQRLIGYARVTLDPGQEAEVAIDCSADLLAFAGLSGDLIVEPGLVDLQIARSVQDVVAVGGYDVVGTLRTVDHSRVLMSSTTIDSLTKVG